MSQTGAFGRKSVTLSSEAVTRDSTAELADAPPDTPARPKEKYEFEAPLGAGGMGEVVLVRDHDLKRQVAMKLLRKRMAADAGHRLKFIAEAQATSQLDHPGIPPVHDMGTTLDGRLYFTMKLVRGRTLREVLKDLVVGVLETRKVYVLHHLVTVLQRVAETVHFAHEKGVIHRDLKPENIMLGSYGEVHVMDWGIAKQLDLPLEEHELEFQVTTAGKDDVLVTQDGSLKGTIAYMSPEQAAGKTSELDRRSDVFALGCLLYEMLTLHPVFPWNATNLLDTVRRGTYVPVTERNPRRPVPEALAVLCEHALEHDVEERLPSARALADGLRAWLDGTSQRKRKRREADRLASAGSEAVAAYHDQIERLGEARARCEMEAERFQPHQSVDEKRDLIQARKDVARARTAAVLAFAESMRLLDGALTAQEDNEVARNTMLELWRDRLERAERRSNTDDVAFALAMIERYDDGRLAALVRGDGTLALTVEGDDARVHLSRFDDADGILVAGPEEDLGPPPIRVEALAMGSYLCRVETSDGPDVLYPVHITRGRVWEGHVSPRTADEIGEGFVFVPGGPFVGGGKSSRRIVEVGDFAIGRSPVTFDDYGEFLASVDASQGPDAAADRVPGTAADGPFMERLENGSYGVRPFFAEGDARAEIEAEHGPDFAGAIPVLGVSWEDAVAYCEWKTRTTGREWRLPTENERRKAGRGVDHRAFPWGDLEDASLGKCSDSRGVESQPEPVGSFPRATSVYGMLDAAGNCWEWTSTWYDERRTARLLCGGAWSSPSRNLGCAIQQWYAPDLRLAVTGFRCARSLP